jgi:hypothetical protein
MRGTREGRDLRAGMVKDGLGTSSVMKEEVVRSSEMEEFL